MAHGRQVVYLIRLNFLNQPYQVRAVGHVSEVHEKLGPVDMRIFIQVVNAVCVEHRGSSFQPVHCVTLFQQEFCEVSTVLTGDPRNQCHFAHLSLFLSNQLLD